QVEVLVVLAHQRPLPLAAGPVGGDAPLEVVGLAVVGQLHRGGVLAVAQRLERDALAGVPRGIELAVRVPAALELEVAQLGVRAGVVGERHLALHRRVRRPLLLHRRLRDDAGVPVRAGGARVEGAGGGGRLGGLRRGGRGRRRRGRRGGGGRRAAAGLA